MRLHILQLGLVGPNDRGLAVGTPCPGYLIRMDDGTNVLVDTGLPLLEPGADPPFWASWLGERDNVISRLAELGLAPRDIALLVCTHFDFDHAGRHDAFPEAELIVQRRHYAVAREHPRFAATRPLWDRPDRRWRFVEGDTTLFPGVELIESSGHVPGHQSVLVRLPETGPVLLAIDAIAHASHLDPETRPIQGADMDEAGVRAATRKLVGIARREAATLIVHGHDPEQWPTLRKSPDCYA